MEMSGEVVGQVSRGGLGISSQRLMVFRQRWLAGVTWRCCAVAERGRALRGTGRNVGCRSDVRGLKRTIAGRVELKKTPGVDKESGRGFAWCSGGWLVFRGGFTSPLPSDRHR
jgi:hypothetical protein